MDWEREVGKGTTVRSTEDETSVAGQGSIVVLLKNWE